MELDRQSRFWRRNSRFRLVNHLERYAQALEKKRISEEYPNFANRQSHGHAQTYEKKFAISYQHSVIPREFIEKYVVNK